MTLYYAERVTEVGHQPVFKKLLPDGEPTELSPAPSQKLYNYCPDGFQWGYEGAGPTQLSLALLLDATTVPDTALTYFREFMLGKVAGFDRIWRIISSEILLWVELRKAHQLVDRFSKN